MRILTTTLLSSRRSRISLLLIAWLIIREASVKAEGFENGPIICPIRLLTGFPCPGCGGIRSLGAISIGNFDLAWSLNPLIFPACLAVIVWAVKFYPITKFLNLALNSFQRNSRLIQVASILSLYILAWLAAVQRFNPDIL
jgi:hypothetical protein